MNRRLLTPLLLAAGLTALTVFSLACHSDLGTGGELNDQLQQDSDNSNSNNNNSESGEPLSVPAFNGRYFGGNDHDRAQGGDTNGQRVLIAGNTGSTNFLNLFGSATAGYKAVSTGNSEAFAVIMSQDLQQVIAWTYLGGTGNDRGYSAKFDAQGNVLICGFTESTNFEGQLVSGPRDAFVAKLSGDLKQLIWARAIGGTDDESPRNAMAVGTTGEIYLTGYTASHDFPVLNALQPNHGGGTNDAFIVKLNSQGQTVWATYLGGPGNETLWGIPQIHSDGTVYVAGSTNSASNLPIVNAFQPQYGGGGNDGLVGRIQANGSAFIYLTYLGGSGDDMVTVNDGFAINQNGEAIVIGQTNSTNFPVSLNAIQPAPSGPFSVSGNVTDIFVTKLKADGSGYLASTYFGGNGHEEASGIAVDSQGEVYVGGNTLSTNIVVTDDALQSQHANAVSSTQPAQYADALIFKLSADFSKLLFSTYFGSNGNCNDPIHCFGDRVRELKLSPDEQWLAVFGDGDSHNLFANRPTNQCSAGQSFYGDPTDAVILTFLTSEF